MSTKVISSKVTSEDYDKLVDTCNEKGCSISEYVRERCIEGIGHEAEVAMQETKKDESGLVDDLKKENTGLDLKLYLANDRVSNLQKRVKDFEELFSHQEIVDRRIRKSQTLGKFGCIKL